MSRPSLLPRLVTRVRRRLFLRRLGRMLVLLCPLVAVLVAGTILLLAGWRFRGSPWSIDHPLFLERLAWLGGSVALVALLAGVAAWLLRPSRTAAALSIDEAFDLKERVSTTLSLTPEQAASPAGQALLADTEERLAQLSLTGPYSLKPTRRAAGIPVALVLGVLAAMFCDRLPLRADDDKAPVSPTLKAELEQVQKDLKELANQQSPPPKEGEKLPKGEDLRKLAEEMKQLAEKEPKTNEEARNLLKDLSTLEEKLRKQEQALADRAEALKQQAEEAEKLRKKPKENPSKPEQAIKDGDFDRAARELQRLSRELQDADLTPEQREQMEKEMEDLREQLDRLAEVKKKTAKDLDRKKKDRDARKNKKKDQKKDGDKGDKDPDMGDDDDDDSDDLDDVKDAEEAEAVELKEAIEALEEMEKALKDGDKGKACEKCDKAAAKLGKLGKKGDRDKAGRQLQALQRMKERLAQSMPGGNPTPASGKRPEAPEKETGSKETKVDGDKSDGGINSFRLLPAAGLKEPKSPQEMKPLIGEAGREAAEALQRQRISRGDADLTRGYFEKLRGQEKKK